MNSTDSLDWWLERLEKMQPDRIELGLDRISRVAQSAGLANPDFRIVTVAGTNGKGSTVAYAASVLKHTGLSVGVYTSPHFIDFNERIVVDDQRATAADLCEAFNHIEGSRGDTDLTYFEFTTLAAIYCFNKSNVDVAVLEVGLGGRLDAVNAWDSEVACITSIGIDHTDWLGDDRESIGREKAGVARTGAVLVCGEKDTPQSIPQYTSEIDAQLLQVGEDFSATPQSDNRWTYTGPHGSVSLTNPAITAAWARDNAAVAICACAQLLGQLPATSALEAAMQEVVISGRMQQFDYRSTSVLLDVAHNQAAAAALAEYLRQHTVSGPTVAVFSCMQDKDAVAIVQQLTAVIDLWFVAQIDYPRAFKADKLAALLAAESSANTEVFTSVIQAFDAAVAQSQDGGRVIVFGSFHMVGPVLHHLRTND